MVNGRMVNRTEIEQARDCIAAGGVVAIPTDTLYGLAADATNPDALEKVYEIKGRPSGMALPVLVSGWEQVEMVTVVAGRSGELARTLAECFWPGPLTLVLPANPELPPRLTAGLDTIAVRMPDHEAPLALAAGLGRPITGTSANRSGEPDLTDPEELRRCLGGLVDGIIVSGEPPQGTASTIVAVSDDDLTLLRAGALPFSEVRRAVGLT